MKDLKFASKVPLMKWYRSWLNAHEDTNLIYARGSDGKPALRQAHFVRDTLIDAFFAGTSASALPAEDLGLGYPERITSYVIGEHTSKSVPLPVYYLERADIGLQFILRDNYHDWNLSVISERPVDGHDLRGLLVGFSREEQARHDAGTRARGDYWGYCYFQGFPPEARFDPHAQDPSEFSMWFSSDYALWTFTWLLTRQLCERRLT